MTNEDFKFLSLRREKLLAVCLFREGACLPWKRLRTVKKSNTSTTSFNFANDNGDVASGLQVGLGAKPGACLLDEIFNVRERYYERKDQSFFSAVIS